MGMDEFFLGGVNAGYPAAFNVTNHEKILSSTQKAHATILSKLNECVKKQRFE